MFFKKAVVIKGSGADKCYLETDLPAPVYPFNENLYFSFDAAADTGEEYIQKTFGLKATVIERAK